MQKIILVFDVFNCREDYAKCMALIEGIETETIGYEGDSWKEIILEEKVSHMVLDGANKSLLYRDSGEWNTKKVTEIIEKGRCGIGKLSKYGKILNAEGFRKEYNKGKEYYYYFRIQPRKKGENFDVKNIQFFYLILQQLNQLRNRICAFIIPKEGNYFEIGEKSSNLSSSYFRFSHYTRWFRDYCDIYGVYNQQGDVIISKLTRKKGGVQHRFFPLMEINEKMLQIMQRSFRFEIEQDKFMVLESSDEYVKDIIEICNQFLKNISGNKRDTKKAICEWIVRESNSGNGITIMEIALFVNLLSYKTLYHEQEMKNVMRLVSNLNQGLLQLFENVVRHSEKKRGIFSFSIIEKEIPYWELSVLDSNRKENVIDNFLAQYELGQSDLKKFESDIILADFFKDYQDGNNRNKKVIEAWKEFRKNNRVACLGLPHLANVLKDCRAGIWAVSTREYRDNNDRLNYVKNYGEIQIEGNKDHCWNIPGTQFHIWCEINNVEEYAYYADVPINTLGNLKQGNEVLKKYIDWKSEEINIDPLKDVEEQEYLKTKSEDDKKLFLSNLWRDKLNKVLSNQIKKEKVLYFIDFEKLQVKEDMFQIEALSKGIVDSDLLKCKIVKEFAFINCTSDMLRIFYRTFMSSSNSFNSQLQLYFASPDGEKELFLAGKTRNMMEANAKEYGYFRGSIPVLIRGQKGESIRLQDSDMIEVCPFDLILKPDTKVSVFENYVNYISERKITDAQSAGYKIPDTHMRLGSKVHLHDFYEISHFFQKKEIAEKFAFLIINQILDDVKKSGNIILFYGYASYSRMILESLVELATQINDEAKFEFAVYQNDIFLPRTAKTISPIVKMFFSHIEVDENQKQVVDENTKIIQIVPISTTMTTFNKMWMAFKKNISENVMTNHLNVYKNITLFWVRDSQKETDYWKEKEGHEIETDLIKPNPFYFVDKKTTWEDSLSCKLCYSDTIMGEHPLVETDPTSTIPSQQLEIHSADDEIDTEQVKINETRILAMRNTLYYGHIVRDTNHYQFYIDTAAFFRQEKDNIRTWLCELNSENSQNDTLHLIVVPKHHTNVGFSYYVSNYYFKGKAHMIIIDSTKEFRSNFVAKYMGICQLIKRAVEENINIDISYVDDTIITGNTFQRVNSLLHSIVPENMRKPIQCEKIFVLVNRLSLASQSSYIHNPKKNFISYVDIAISSLRNYGNSCVLCNLQSEAKSFYLKSSIKMVSDYWSDKIIDYNPRPFDQVTQKELQEKGFLRFLCSHVAREHIYKGNDKEQIMLSVLNIFIRLEPNDNEKSPIFLELQKDTKKSICALLKILCRPFFSFGRVFKECILDLYLLFAEEYIGKSWIGQDEKDRNIRLSEKKYLQETKLWEKIIHIIEKLVDNISYEDSYEFVWNYLLEGLGDLKSNYIIRKEAIININRFLVEHVPVERMQEAYDKWTILILRMINGSSDETKCLWLETLLTFGKEYTDIKDEKGFCFGEELFHEFQIKDCQKKLFLRFWSNLIVANTRIYSEGIEKCSHEDDAEKIWDNYYLKNLRNFSKMDKGIWNQEEDSTGKNTFKSIVNFAALLKSKDNSSVTDRYEQLYERMCQMLETTKIWLIGENNDETDGYYMVAGSNEQVLSYLTPLRKMIQEDTENFLNQYGYFIKNDLLLLKFSDTNEGDWRISPLYCLIRFDTEDLSKIVRSARKVLLFRHQLVQWIKEDFMSNALPIMKQAESRTRHLEVDQSGHHLSANDMNAIKAEIESTISLRETERLDYSVRDWLLLKFYVNTRISKIYRAIWTGQDEERMRFYLYHYEKNQEEGACDPRRPLKILSDLFWREPQGKQHNSVVKYSGESYLEIFNPVLNISFNKKVLSDIMELKDCFAGIKCISFNNTYYRSDYIACIIMDILFSAIECGFNWDLPYIESDYAQNYFENDSRVHYIYLKNNSKNKCKVDFSIEISNQTPKISCLIISNPVYLGCNKDIENRNKEIEAVLRGEGYNGISLYTMAWYIDNLKQKLDSTNAPKVECYYEYRGNKAYFVIKLPIIKND